MPRRSPRPPFRERHPRLWPPPVAVVVAGAVAALLVAGGLVVLIAGGSGPEVGTRRPRRVPTTVAALTPSTTSGRSCRAPLTAPAPLRLWIAGDSLAWSVGTGLGTVAARTGVVAPVYESHVSSGLTSPGFFDWPRRIDAELTRLDPEVVVIVLGTNDWSAAPTAPTATDAWRTKYTALVQAVVDRIARPGRTLVWFGPPILKDPTQDAGSHAVADVIAAVVERNPDAVFVDGRTLLDAADGTYTGSVEVDGRKVQVRTGDGIHFTPDGADVVGRALFAVLDAQCRLSAQSVPDGRQVVVETKGSNAYPGSTGGSSASTTPGTTVAPAPTSPPTTVPAPVPSTVPPTTPATAAPVTTTVGR